MVHTTIFRSNRSQAVRLPKDVAFPDKVKRVTVLRDGNRRVIVPSNAVWDDFFDSPGIDLPARIRADGVAISQRIYRIGPKSRQASTRISITQRNSKRKL